MGFSPPAMGTALRQNWSSAHPEARGAQHHSVSISSSANELGCSDNHPRDQQRAGMIRKQQNPQIFLIRRKTGKFAKIVTTSHLRLV